ncbi:unnamed protein product [Litomosoides sigmodontis]|uniref:SRP9 domain-containing protein n=1 Tax=Litomosoides sigmodontis TaxID=42156 RepID=A0A3P6SQW6_LITSI|nr:unnamed protein product [Litomosoides sigmodontis]
MKKQENLRLKSIPVMTKSEIYSNTTALKQKFSQRPEGFTQSASLLGSNTFIFRSEQIIHVVSAGILRWRCGSICSGRSILKERCGCTLNDVRRAGRKSVDNPTRCRFVTKYNHKKGKMTLKMTDDVVCLQYDTDQMQDVKRLEKLTATLMRHIVSK